MPGTRRKSPEPHSARVIPHVTWRGDDVFRVTCNCGLQSWDFDTEAEAQEERDRHIAATERAAKLRDGSNG